MNDPYRKPGERAPIPPHLRLWLTKSGDVVKGPFDVEAIRQSFKDGYIKSSTLVRAEDEAEWRPLSEVKEITLGVAAAPPKEEEAPGSSSTPLREASVWKLVAYGAGGAAALAALVLLVTPMVAWVRSSPATEAVGAARPASLLTHSGDPAAALPKAFAGIRFGDSSAEVARKCRASGHAIDDVAHDSSDVRCDGMPVAEPGIEGDYVNVQLCGGKVCEVSITIDEQPAARYRKAIEALTTKYGKPSDVVATPPESEEAAQRTCAGDAAIASTTWNWLDGVNGRIDVELHCLDHRPWTWVSVMDAQGTARYRDVDASL